jgi:diamine N-acetyltransferase
MKGKNIKLRAMEPSDIDLLYNWENDKTLWHISNTIAPFSMFVLEQYILSSHQDIYTNKQLRFMIDLKDGDTKKKTIGTIDLFEFEPTHKRAGVGILIDNQYRNKGYASESIELLINYCFNTLNLHQLFCNISSDNEVSLKLFEKHNFKIIGLKKEWAYINKKWTDEYLLQLIND